MYKTLTGGRIYCPNKILHKYTEEEDKTEESLVNRLTINISPSVLGMTQVRPAGELCSCDCMVIAFGRKDRQKEGKKI